MCLGWNIPFFSSGMFTLLCFCWWLHTWEKVKSDSWAHAQHWWPCGPEPGLQRGAAPSFQLSVRPLPRRCPTPRPAHPDLSHSQALFPLLATLTASRKRLFIH